MTKELIISDYVQTRENVIEGLEWILEDDRFGFGVNWENGNPKDDYEIAGKIITDTIALIKEQKARIRELEEKLKLLEYGDQDILQSGMIPAT